MRRNEKKRQDMKGWMAVVGMTIAVCFVSVSTFAEDPRKPWLRNNTTTVLLSQQSSDGIIQVDAAYWVASMVDRHTDIDAVFVVSVANLDYHKFFQLTTGMSGYPAKLLNPTESPLSTDRAFGWYLEAASQNRDRFLLVLKNHSTINPVKLAVLMNNSWYDNVARIDLDNLADKHTSTKLLAQGDADAQKNILVLDAYMNIYGLPMNRSDLIFRVDVANLDYKKKFKIKDSKGNVYWLNFDSSIQNRKTARWIGNNADHSRESFLLKIPVDGNPVDLGPYEIELLMPADLTTPSLNHLEPHWTGPSFKNSGIKIEQSYQLQKLDRSVIPPISNDCWAQIKKMIGFDNLPTNEN